nr:MAG: ORF1 [Torque teno midi virus]
MPFWWGRRRKFWYGRRRRPRYRRRWPKRRAKYYRRRRPTRFTRRRRRRRKRRQVRRKRKTIPVFQWQPDSVRNCKIKGYQAFILGAQGTQYLCYTNERFNFTPPQFPGGGGFGRQTFTLQYLYEESIFKNNIWTATNVYTDLCRFLRAKFYFYRHQKADFIITYNRQGPFQLLKHTYTASHPYMLMQSRHRKILLSQAVNPKGKLQKKFIIKPPKQMISKWFFQKQFAPQNLFEITAAAASFSYPRLSCCNENQIITIYYLNPQFFQFSNWAETQSKYYSPYSHPKPDITFTYPEGRTTKQYNPPFLKSTSPNPYYESISLENGWFSKKVLTATKVTNGPGGEGYAHLPLNAARYNPAEDNGVGNMVYLVAVNKGQYDKPSEDNLVYRNAPLWLIFYGYVSFIKQIKGSSFLSLHMFVVRSPYIKPQPSAITKDFFPFVDLNFTVGNNPAKAYITSLDAKLWYPTVEHQIETINNFVMCGPYIPKYTDDRDSTWELPYRYIFYFKWGGPQTPQQAAADPNQKNTYTVPDTLEQTLQISNPLKQSPESLLHNWDIRRGLITERAFKRIFENIETDTDFQPDTEETPKKRKKITGELLHPQEKNKEVQECLQSLFEEDTYQEIPQTQENILQLINKQREQQQQLKHNILMLLQEMKHKQQMLQLTTGLLD